MRTWRRRAQIGIISIASFVLLVTVLPQVASGIGLGSLATRLASSTMCSGSSGTGSSQCTPTPGAVTGKVTVTGAPKGFVAPLSGIGACPGTKTKIILCPDPAYALADNGVFTLSLAPGPWVIDGFYEINPFGGAFLGTQTAVWITAGRTITRNLRVPYESPASLSGSITVTGISHGVVVESLSVLLCPAIAPYNGVTPSIDCVNGYATDGPGTTGTYQITGLPPGKWTAYPGYCTQYGCATNAKAGRSVLLVAGKASTLDLTTPFLTPTDGLLDATVTVTGAPAGFSPSVGLQACQTTASGGTCITGFPLGSSSFELLLADGAWQINGLYQAPVFGNAILGPTKTITIKGGRITTVAVTVPYRVLGTAAGSIDVPGLPKGVHPTSYMVTACPASGGGGLILSLECVTEYSGPGGYSLGAASPKRLAGAAANAASGHIARAASRQLNSYSLPTLTPGRWVLTAGYGTAFGTFTSPKSTTVTIAAHKTTTTTLTVPYQVPIVGLVTGTVSVIGAPLMGFQAGARACDAPPTSTCSGEVDAYVDQNGAYQMLLAPGTWWVSGMVSLYTSSTSTEVVTAPRKVTVTAGAQLTERFVVVVS